MNNINWYCDNCDAHLNKQSGFETSEGTWVCEECGYLNDVTENNILNEEEQEFVDSAYVTCPRCSAHMIPDRYDDNRFNCPDCGHTGKFDYSEDLLVPDDLPPLIATKYKVRFILLDGSIEEDDEEFENYEDAEIYAQNYINDAVTGAEVLHLSNPFEYDGVVRVVSYEIIEIEEIIEDL